MKKIILYCFIIILSISLSGCFKKETKEDKNLTIKTSKIEDNIKLTKLNDNVWIHTTYKEYGGVKYPSNGLIVNTSKGLVLIDTPWDNNQTEKLLNVAKDKFNKDFTLALVTHAHADRIGGIDTLLKNKIEVLSTKMTAELAVKNNFKKPEGKLSDDTSFEVGNTKFEIYYPGAGHTVDNIVVYLPKDKILLGGCLIKGMEFKDLGNTKEANVKEWPISVNKVIKKYPNPKIIIPGHGKFGDMNLINHTLKLLENKN